jgi:uncharacterized lipoprotein YddW (UPF0748 family)
MCPGAAGWRTFWKQQIDRIIRDYDFDGIYFDFWYGRMVCDNTPHRLGEGNQGHPIFDVQPGERLELLGRA